MKFIKNIFSGIRWKLTVTYTLATLLVLFLVEVLIAVSANRYAYTSINFIYSSAQSLSDSKYALAAALVDPMDQDYLDAWIQEKETAFLLVSDRQKAPKDALSGNPPDNPSDNSDNMLSPEQDSNTLIDLIPKTVAFSASKSTLTVVNADGIVAATNHPQTFPVGSPIFYALNEDESAMLTATMAATIPAPQFSVMEEEITTLVLPIRNGDKYYGAVVAQYYAPTFFEQVQVAVVGFLPELPVFILISSGIGIMFGFLIASSFTRRIDQMEATTLQWGEGDFSKKAEVKGNDELSTLAFSLNRMSEQFQKLIEKEQMLATIEERNRLARDLHDSVKQQIFAISMNLGAVKSLLNSDLQKAILQVDVSSKLAQQALDELTTLINTLRPVQLGDQSLQDALKEYLMIWQKQSGVSVVFRIDSGKTVIAQEAEQSLFRVIQEALSNISRHSRATAASIFLTFYEDHLTLQISDNGVGFDKKTIKHGLGLQSMEERVKELGGTLKMNSTASGTTITIMVPQAGWEKKNGN